LEQNEENRCHENQVAYDDKQEGKAADKHLYECHDQPRNGADYKEE
jgi:hypothetical protein